MTIRNPIIIILAALFIGVIVWAVTSRMIEQKKVQASDYISSAESLMDLKSYKAVIEKCSDGIKEYPDESRLYELKATAYARLDDYEKAVEVLSIGYKRTKDEDLSKQFEQYQKKLPEDKDANFTPLGVSYGSDQGDDPDSRNMSAGGRQGTNGSGKVSKGGNEPSIDLNKDLKITTVPEVNLPKVTLPETTTTTTAPPKEEPEEESASSDKTADKK